MPVQDEFAARYNEMHAARATWRLVASDAWSAYSQLGLVGPADLVVAFTDGRGYSSYSAPDGCEVVHITEPSSDGFIEAGARASGRVHWFVRMLGGDGVRVSDLRGLALEARRVGAVLVVDNTLPSFYGCHPLELGASLTIEPFCGDGVRSGAGGNVLVSVAKSVRGRGRRRQVDAAASELYDVLASRFEELDIAACAECGLGCIEDVSNRLQRQMDSARAVAEYLSAHPLVASVRYPGLKSHIDHAAAGTVLLHGAGPLVEFELGHRSASEDFVNMLRVPLCPGDEGEGCHLALDKGVVRLLAGGGDPLRLIDALEVALRVS